MKNKILFQAILLFVFCLNLSAATAGKIKGLVSDENGDPLAGANIVVEGTTLGAESDENGYYYIIGVRAGSYKVTCQFMGYSPTSFNIKVRTGLTSKLNFKLYPMDFELDEIVYCIQSASNISKDVTTSQRSIGLSSLGIKRNNSYSLYQPNIDDLSYYDNPDRINTEEYISEDENPFIKTKKQPFSTFSIDVDNASYTIIRRFIQNGQKPKKEAVRIEEMINYFSYDYPKPDDGHPFAIITEVSDAPWSKNKLLHIGLQGSSSKENSTAKNNLVFLLDVSGSMGVSNKLPLVKRSLKLLLDNLSPNDRVAIVVYAGAAGVVLPSTRVSDKDRIIKALNRLSAGGSTAGGAGIKLAYKIARENFMKNGNNRIILATDGDFNVGVRNTEKLVKMIKNESRSGIFLTITGYGMGNYKDDRMEKIADNGNGNYFYIDNFAEAKKVFVNELKGTLYAIAKDVKIQLEFNKEYVKSYRLIGYENRMLKKEDFENDTIDAGELGANHTVTALYELVLSDNGNEKGKNVADVHFRYKKIDEDQSILFTKKIKDENISLEESSDNFRFSAAIAEFGMLLRESKYSGEATFEQVRDLAFNSTSFDKFGYKDKFVDLVKDCIHLDTYGNQNPKIEIDYLPEPKTYANINEIIKNEPGIATDFRGNFHFRGGRTQDVDYAINDISTNDESLMFAKPLKLNFVTMDFRTESSAYSRIENHNILNSGGLVSYGGRSGDFASDKDNTTLQIFYATDITPFNEKDKINQGEFSLDGALDIPGTKKKINYYTALNYSLKNSSAKSYNRTDFNTYDLAGFGLKIPQLRENDINYIFKAELSPLGKLSLSSGFFKINNHHFGHGLFSIDDYNYLYKNTPETMSESKTENDLFSISGKYVIDQRSYTSFKITHFNKEYEYLPGSQRPDYFLDSGLKFNDGSSRQLLDKGSFHLYEAYAKNRFSRNMLDISYKNQINRNHLLKSGLKLGSKNIDYYQMYGSQFSYSPEFSIKAKSDDRYKDQGYYKTDFEMTPFELTTLIGDKLEFEDLVVNSEFSYTQQFSELENYNNLDLSSYEVKLEFNHSIDETSKISTQSNFKTKIPAYSALYESLSNSDDSKKLKNEKISHYEISYSKEFSKILFEATLYLRDLKDLVYYHNVFTNDYGYRDYDNTGYCVSKGFEIRLDHILEDNFLFFANCFSPLLQA